MQWCTLWGVEFCAGQEIKYLYGKEKESAFERTSPSLKQDPMNHEQWVSTALAAAETMDKDALAPTYNRVLDCISCQDSRPISLGAQTQVCLLTLPQSTETHWFLELAAASEIISREPLPLTLESRRALPRWGSLLSPGTVFWQSWS